MKSSGDNFLDSRRDRLIHNAHRIELNVRESMRKGHSTLKDDGQSGK